MINKELKQELTYLENRLLNKILDHQDYHKRNEHRWGLIRIMRNHPFKTILFGILMGISLSLLFGPQIKDLILSLVLIK